MGNRLKEFLDSIREIGRSMSGGGVRGQLVPPAIVAVIVMVAALFGLPSKKDTTESVTAGGSETTSEVTDGAAGGGGGLGGGAAATTRSGATKPGAAPADANQLHRPGIPDSISNPDAEIEYARKLAAMIHPVTTKLPNGNPNTWVGVTKDKIKLVFSYDQANCGVNVINAISAAGANLSTEGRYYRGAPKNADEANAQTVEAVNSIMKAYNDRGFEAAQELPHIKDLVGEDPTHPFYGRKVVHEFIDGGSFQCPETTTAAAVEIVQNRKPFAVFNNFDGAAYNMAEALHAKAPADKRPMHFGSLWLSDKDYDRWHPYSWTQFISGTKGAELYASYVCARLVGKFNPTLQQGSMNAARSPQFKDAKRKFALLYPDLEEARNVGDDLRRFIKRDCGADIYGSRVFEYSTDVSRAADEGTTIAIRLRQEGVTTLTYLMDPVFPLFQIIAQEGQGYRPEYVWTPTGYYDSSVVQRLYEQPQIDGNSFGVTAFGVPGGYGFGPGDPFYLWHDQHRVSPKTKKKCDPATAEGMSHDPEYCKAPGAIVTWYYTSLATIAGILFAGPDLTPAHVTTGLQRVPRTRYGGAGATQKPFAALLGAGTGKHYFIVDATEYRWRSGFVSPPPETKLGWAEWPDCQRHYLSWTNNRLADGWEKDGKYYNAYCGNAKYVFKPYRPTGPDEEACEDTPSGKCETDGYPRWRDW
jgi:hypothetical protein